MALGRGVPVAAPGRRERLPLSDVRERLSQLAFELARSFVGYARWVVRDATTPSLHSYLGWLVGLTSVVYFAERARPWLAWPRRAADDLRGVVYAWLNFFGFGLLGFAAVSDVTAAHTTAFVESLGVHRLTLPIAHPLATAALYLVVRDLIEYGIHRLLHRVPALWRIHAVHHAPREMSVFVHLRFHPLETVVYRTLEFLPMWLLGFGAGDFFVAHIAALLVGHLNHANLRVPLGPLRYVFNSSEMHLLHHAKELPAGASARHRGVNFGLTFSVWDFLFGTASLPSSPRNAPIPLGFEGVEAYPEALPAAMLAPFRHRTKPIRGGESRDDAS